MTGQRIMTLVNRRKALKNTRLKLHREKPKELSITNKKPGKLVGVLFLFQDYRILIEFRRRIWNINDA